jgi:hypothetical protein
MLYFCSKALISRSIIIPGESVANPSPFSGAVPITAEARQDAADLESPVRRFTFFAALVLIFLRFGMVSELLNVLTGTNGYLLYIFGPLSVLGILLTGGLRRSLRRPTARYWLGFLFFVLLAVPFRPSSTLSP